MLIFLILIIFCEIKTDSTGTLINHKLIWAGFMKIRFAVTFSLIMGCAQPSEQCGSSVNAAGAIQQASTSQNIYGGFFESVVKSNNTSKNRDARCTMTIAQKSGNKLTLLTSIHCISFREFESSQVTLYVGKNNEDLGTYGYVPLKGIIENPEFYEIQKIKGLNVKSEKLRDLLFRSHMPDKNMGSMTCKDKERSVNPGFNIGSSCYSMKETALLDVSLDSENNAIFNRIFGDFSQLDISAQRENWLALKRLEALRILEWIFTQQVNLKTPVISNEGLQIAPYFGNQKDGDITRMYKAIREELILDTANKTAIEPSEEMYKASDLYYEQVKVVDKKYLDLFYGTLSNSSSFTLFANATPNFSNPKNRGKPMFVPFVNPNIKFNENVNLDETAFYNISSESGTIVLGFKNKGQSSLYIEAGDSGSTIISNGKVIATISTVEGWDVQRPSYVELPAYVEEVAIDDNSDYDFEVETPVSSTPVSSTPVIEPSTPEAPNVDTSPSVSTNQPVATKPETTIVTVGQASSASSASIDLNTESPTLISRLENESQPVYVQSCR